MQLSGTNTLLTPLVPQMNYVFDKIKVSSTGIYDITARLYNSGVYHTHVTSVPMFRLASGKILNGSNRFVATYNTGESFALSGWVDAIGGVAFLSVKRTLVQENRPVSVGKLIGRIDVGCPSGNTLSSDITLMSRPITTSASFQNVPIHGYTTGYVYSDVPMFITGGNLQFYQSYEQLLVGPPTVAYVSPDYPLPVVYSDNDSSYSANDLTFDYSYLIPFGESIQRFTISRTGLYEKSVVSIYDTSFSSGFSGLFDGYWSGSGFYFQGAQDILTLDYQLNMQDMFGNKYPVTGYYEVTLPNNVTMAAEYVTGFRLTASGEYANPPVVQTTGYYYVSGIQQSLESLLFSTGCSGALQVSFASANNWGTGASGLLVMTPVTFSGLYGGVKTFNLVTQYVTTNVGTGYTMAPRAIVNTGQYGSKCYDVPLSSGYNEAWYRPFRTSGAIYVEAGWLTGEALYVTGIMSNASTGYRVTGLSVYNIGSGFNLTHPPLISFVRTGVDVLTQNASGVFNLHLTSVQNLSYWKASAGVAGSSLTTTGLSGYVDLSEAVAMTVRIECSGLDITAPITGICKVQITNTPSLPYVQTPFYYVKYFDTDPYALKKNSNELLIYPIYTDLSFTLNQSELDELYSDAGYTSNSWPFELGDFDF